MGQLEERALEARSRADARASRKVDFFSNKALQAELRAAEAESSAGEKVANIVTALQTRTMKAEERAGSVWSKLVLRENESEQAKDKIALLEEQVRWGEGREKQIVSLHDELQQVKEKTRQELAIEFDSWKDELRRTVTTGHMQTLQGEIAGLAKVMEEMEEVKSRLERATEELTTQRRLTVRERNDLQEQLVQLKAE